MERRGLTGEGLMEMEARRGVKLNLSGVCMLRAFRVWCTESAAVMCRERNKTGEMGKASISRPLVCCLSATHMAQWKESKVISSFKC